MLRSRTWAEYRRQVDEAKARGDFLILLVPMKPTDRPRTEKGVTYCGTELEALLVKTSMLPSKRGNKSLLGDVTCGRSITDRRRRQSAGRGGLNCSDLATWWLHEGQKAKRPPSKVA
jgi:hypothetical protein